MKTTIITPVSFTRFTSEVRPDVWSDDERDKELIAWADAHPVAWKIVTTTKSKPFGKNASTYFGCEQKSDAPQVVLARLRTFHAHVMNDGVPAHTKEDFWQWRAKFTLEHFTDKGFKGGFFQLWDGKFDRSCAYLDFTPETREEVIERFLAWCDPYYDKVAVKIDGKIVRELKQPHEVEDKPSKRDAAGVER